MAFSRGIGNFGVRGPRSAAAAAFDPVTLPSIAAIFDPSQGVFSDAGSTPASVDGTWRRWVASYPLDGSVYADQATSGNQFTWRQGANGMYWMDGSAGNRYADVNLGRSSPETLILGCKRDASEGAYARITGPHDSFGYRAFVWGNNDEHIFQLKENGGEIEHIPTPGTGFTDDWQAYSMVWAGSGQTNRLRLRGATETTGAGEADGGTVTAWRIGGAGAVLSKSSFTYLILCTSELSDADRAKAENYIYSRLPT